MGKSAPGSPDYYKAAGDTGRANRPNQYSQFGSTTWDEGPNGQWSQHTNMNPAFQQAFGQFSQGLQGGEAARKSASDAIYKQESSRLDPMWGQREGAQRNQLINQGLSPDSEAFRRAMDDFGRSRNDAYQGAMNTSIAGGSQAAMQNFMMNMGGLQGLKGLTQQFGFTPGPNYMDAASALGNYKMQGYQTEQKGSGDAAGGAGQLLSAIIPFLL